MVVAPIISPEPVPAITPSAAPTGPNAAPAAPPARIPSFIPVPKSFNLASVYPMYFPVNGVDVTVAHPVRSAVVTINTLLHNKRNEKGITSVVPFLELPACWIAPTLEVARYQTQDLHYLRIV